MGCQHPVPLTAGAALDQFCHHGTVTSGRDASPDHYQLCMEHYRVESEDAGSWYITGIVDKWPRQPDTGFLGMPSFRMDKITGKTQLLSVAD